MVRLWNFGYAIDNTSDKAKSKTSRCTPELKLSFDDYLKDTSGNNVYVRNENVFVKGGYAFFNGKSRLLIPRFTNSELGRTFIIRIKYKEAGKFSGQGSVQALVSNGDCKAEPSILLFKDNYGVNFVVKTEGKNNVGFEIPKENSEWKHVEYVFANDRLEGVVNHASKFSWAVDGKFFIVVRALLRSID
ncbi:hypothetical protein KUTeg_022826 [Tegillarca granosa]|uniref:Uncharacterized protein n=1 Tax=Tegillarca granosa TaxID=220873 RepID=A0ABQ9E4V2_TEGGR|nr:hypothetical protein KUTeg_022826 [Tegillarca granosa]